MHRLGLPPSGPRGIVFVTQFNPFLDYQHYFEPGDPIKYRNSVVKVTRKGLCHSSLNPAYWPRCRWTVAHALHLRPAVAGLFLGAHEQGFAAVAIHTGMRLFSVRDGSSASYADRLP